MIENVGKIIDEIPVTISYKIIELFSAGLYSSPNKAFEELVSNSYDAGADKVCVYVPTDKTVDGAVLWVADNGASMDVAGLKQFWRIGESQKRKTMDAGSSRSPIGKFGIGKLATYILANNLTLICKAKDGRYYAVNMDYSQISKDSTANDAVKLDEKELSLDEVQQTLQPLIQKNGQDLVSFKLWGKGAEATWTFAVLSSFKPKATEIKDGRLKWVLSTAIPLSPQFNLHFNGGELKSSKALTKPWHTFIIGDKDDKNYKKSATIESIGGQQCISFPNLKNVFGEIELYRDSLLTGKSEDLGRSHGIFLRVRERLVNLDDPLLGMDALSHGVFNRCRILINADELDANITSTRESIKSSAALDDLRDYIKWKFNSVVREWYFKEVGSQEEKNRASYKIANAAASLSRQPIIAAARRFLEGQLDDLLFIKMPEHIDAAKKERLLANLESDLTSEKGIIKDVEWVVLSPEDFVANLDIETGVAKINMLHPFFANFSEEVRSLLPFQLIALTEILTECFLLDSGVAQNEIKAIMQKRDRLLRDLTFSDRPNAPLVAQILSATLGNSAGLEEAVYQAFNSLGFETTKIGGPGKPDGKAIAYLGPLKSPLNYTFTYDAKSTSKEKIQAATAHVSGVKRHRDDYGANFACVVAIDFEGANDPNSAVNKEAKADKISLIRAKDLVTLVLMSSPTLLGLNDLRDLFENCHTVIETSKWVEDLKSKKVEKGPIKELLQAVYNFIKTDTEVPELGAVRVSDPYLQKNYSKEQLKTLIESLEKLMPNYIGIDQDEIISMNVRPDKILSTLGQIYTSEVPLEFRDAYLKAFK